MTIRVRMDVEVDLGIEETEQATFSHFEKDGDSHEERINGMSMVDGIHAMADGDFATLEDL